MPPSLRRVFLVQGDIYCDIPPTEVSTILGSCVSVCLWDSNLHIGGMNHYVLPGERNEVEAQNTRYGDVAIEQLYWMMLDLGCRPDMLQAKVFGGASVFPMGARQVTVGERNVDLALERMRAYRIPVTAQQTGGKTGRQVSFHTGTGVARSRTLTESTFVIDVLPRPPNRDH
jgi:chemotaxis protein CheD